MMMRFVLRLLITTMALYVAVRVVPGLSFTGTPLLLMAVAFVFTLVNMVLKPIVTVLALPLVLLTLGLFLLVINALMLWVTGAVAGALDLGFTVSGFAAAFWGALVVSVANLLISAVLPDARRRRD